MTRTLFDLPTQPEEIGVLLAPAPLRRIDFSALDYDTTRRTILEYVLTYYPNEFNDFVANNGVIMLLEILASQVAKLGLRADMLSNESFLATCVTELAAVQHLALLGQQFRQQTPATTDIEISLAAPLVTDLQIPPGLSFIVRGPDGSAINYELFRAPGDFTSSITIRAGKRGVVGYGIEGQFAGPMLVRSPGGTHQTVTISETNILAAPIFVDVGFDLETERWTVTTEPLERAGANDKIVNAQLLSDHLTLTFGDNVNGMAPLAGQQISIQYRLGGGIRGRIGTGAINEERSVIPLPPYNTPVQVLFRNITPSSGGTDRETVVEAKKRAPRDFAVRAFAADRPASIVTSKDYAHVASTFAHPVFGAVSKAAAVVRTGRNANLISLYVLAEGSAGLATPSLGLKEALRTYLLEYNVATDSVEVLDGAVRVVDLDLTVVVGRNADATVVKNQVQQALDTLMDYRQRDMGAPLYTSDIVEAVRAVDGVVYVDLFEPAANLLATGKISEQGTTDSEAVVGINEVIVEGARQVRFYYERAER